MAVQRDYYEIMGVAKTATSKEIADAYRKLAIKYHPDKNPGDADAVAKFKEAAQAFEVLHDADKRARYDRFGHAGVEGAGVHQFTDVNDIMEAFGDIFGGGLFGDILRRRLATRAAASSQRGRRRLYRAARSARSGPRRHQDRRIRAPREVRRMRGSGRGQAPSRRRAAIAAAAAK